MYDKLSTEYNIRAAPSPKDWSGCNHINAQIQGRTRRKIKEEGIVFHTGSHCNGAPDVACTWQRRYTVIRVRRQSRARDSTVDQWGWTLQAARAQIHVSRHEWREMLTIPAWTPLLDKPRLISYSRHIAKWIAVSSAKNKMSLRWTTIVIASAANNPTTLTTLIFL